MLWCGRRSDYCLRLIETRRRAIRAAQRLLVVQVLCLSGHRVGIVVHALEGIRVSLHLRHGRVELGEVRSLIARVLRRVGPRLVLGQAENWVSSLLINLPLLIDNHVQVVARDAVMLGIHGAAASCLHGLWYLEVSWLHDVSVG